MIMGEQIRETQNGRECYAVIEHRGAT